MTKWSIEIEGTTPLLMHRYIGIPEAKTAKEKPDQAQAESFAYRDKEGNLAIPIRNMRGCIVGGFVSSAGSKMKSSTKLNVSPRIKVYSTNTDKMNISLGLKEYAIDKQSVPSGSKNMGIRDWCVRPMIENWSASFILEETLGIDEKELGYKLDFAGSDVGILSNRPNGYGRFKVVSLEKLK